eukprot:CAMPEP_0196818146 /NCGR_PEP_ID=MMETSP1362-20130617/64211_1 /TAXON_ID=163516 /ORGANISM="Leptocylindrus danicus, Strain CCMP1856" /LENGTH=78 /DNA_ID=CAMNT_0042196113 /DNA_START=15 /DNA_END=248 /DNA_ORIENTATION=-
MALPVFDGREPISTTSVATNYNCNHMECNTCMNNHAVAASAFDNNVKAKEVDGQQNSGSDTALILFTSGTTKGSKGVA